MMIPHSSLCIEAADLILMVDSHALYECLGEAGSWEKKAIFPFPVL